MAQVKKWLQCLGEALQVAETLDDDNAMTDLFVSTAQHIHDSKDHSSREKASVLERLRYVLRVLCDLDGTAVRGSLIPPPPLEA